MGNDEPLVVQFTAGLINSLPAWAALFRRSPAKGTYTGSGAWKGEQGAILYLRLSLAALSPGSTSCEARKLLKVAGLETMRYHDLRCGRAHGSRAVGLNASYFGCQVSPTAAVTADFRYVPP